MGVGMGVNGIRGIDPQHLDRGILAAKFSGFDDVFEINALDRKARGWSIWGRIRRIVYDAVCPIGAI